jgi:acyl-CoA synthetase (AMP-forming)/AMP-acid ligase II
MSSKICHIDWYIGTIVVEGLIVFILRFLTYRQPVVPFKCLYLSTRPHGVTPEGHGFVVCRYMFMAVGVRCMLRIKTDDILYTPLPLYHTAGGMTGVGQVLLHGASLAIRSKFSASNFWADCVTYGCTVSAITLQYLDM